jgi:hypothetical protein
MDVRNEGDETSRRRLEMSVEIHPEKIELSLRRTDHNRDFRYAALRGASSIQKWRVGFRNP